MAKNRKVKRPARTERTAKAPAAAKAPTAPKKRRAPRAAKPKVGHSGRSREIVGIISLGVAIFLVAALLSLQLGGGTLMGPFGRTIALGVYGLAGICSYGLVAMLVVGAIRLLREQTPIVRPSEILGGWLGVVSLGALLHLAAGDYLVAGHAPGGIIGEHVAEIFRAMISTAGTVLLALTGLLSAAIIATPLRTRQVGVCLAAAGNFLWAGISRAGTATAQFCGDVVRAILPERDQDEYYEYEDEPEEPFDAFAHEGTDPGRLDPPIIALDDSGAPAEVLDGADTERLDDEELAARIAALSAAQEARKANAKAAAPAAAADDDASAPQAADAQDDDQDEADSAAVVAGSTENADDDASKPAAKARKAAPKAAKADKQAAEDEAGPVIVESRFAKKKPQSDDSGDEANAAKLDFIPLHNGTYSLPPLNLLEFDDSQRSAFDRASMLELSARLAQTLENYGVKGEVVAIRPGPVVTMYEFAPAPGTRVNKIANLSDDLAMSLEALSVRIVAPIPGKAAVGIEVPNKSRETVYLKEVLCDDVFKSGKHKLPLAVGKDIEGAPSVVDLAKMPHLLVAGTTGSGKSVAVNSMITSLLYSRTPAEVRVIMVDPKMLELSIYEGIPHLLLPVVTDPKKANLALRWGVEEMERRYDLLASMGVRDLGGYNKKAAKLRAEYEAEKLRRAAEAAERAAAAAAANQGGDAEFDDASEEELPPLPEPPEDLPYIVIIIDEFADLMMCAPKEVETSVARIAQKARAAGIHLVLATQRPSVDVITGLIKANFPSRAAFRVTSKVDSRTILDQGGAEALLGAGDMLFSDRGASPCRYHGCFVDEEEIARVVDFLKQQGQPVYNMDILKPREEEDDGNSGGSGGDEVVDEMYDRAVALVSETQQASISMIQRRLRVGYNRAARMVEQMEREGVVSSPDHTNKREVLIQPAA
ncbi:FtsK/SpoIIIE family DNA translocase [Haliangium ochraceum]|uniref:Cell division FtsK/SpoIIIE n=1 Tax=Haliangium ochraceum (strain DSM 14365 / JCM 11303 / SMP-2) TaxID=502025 RepID=D0LT31_HALO1|nr:DNA translocase FtsK [Haliangium ochraceum]ACY19167.1 cell division FtsK/SpoIIIE [Haliangium ochraceum DSM 14365]